MSSAVDWCSYERHRLQLAYLALLDQLAGYCEAQQLYAKGLDFGQAVLRCDPARECTHRQLMRLRYRVGDRTSALRQYERCTFLMAQEFGIQPSTGAVALYEQIRADRVPDIPLPRSTESPVVQQPVPERRETAALAGLHVRLDQIQASLSALQESVMSRSGARVEHALYLSLVQRDPGGKNVPDVCPTILFYHQGNFGKRIEGRSTGIHFREGDNLGVTEYSGIRAGNIFSSVNVGIGTTATGGHWLCVKGGSIYLEGDVWVGGRLLYWWNPDTKWKHIENRQVRGLQRH